MDRQPQPLRNPICDFFCMALDVRLALGLASCEQPVLDMLHLTASCLQAQKKADREYKGKHAIRLAFKRAHADTHPSDVVLPFARFLEYRACAYTQWT